MVSFWCKRNIFYFSLTCNSRLYIPLTSLGLKVIQTLMTEYCWLGYFTHYSFCPYVVTGYDLYFAPKGQYLPRLSVELKPGMFFPWTGKQQNWYNWGTLPHECCCFSRWMCSPMAYSSFTAMSLSLDICQIMPIEFPSLPLHKAGMGCGVYEAGTTDFGGPWN